MSDKPRTVMEGTPEAIYLQTGDAGDEDMTFDQLGDVTWAEDWIDRGDTKYIRADVAERELSAARAEADRLREALEKVERWQFPPTGKFWESGNPVSYIAAYGSNGERDYMREVARAALAATRKEGSNG